MRILLVEDSADNRVLVLSYLKETSDQIDIAENGRSAVEKFTSERYDLVLMDVEMPVMDGYAATRAIREWERAHGRAAVPIVALTAYALPEDVRRSLEAGCTTHLAKPVRRHQLIQTIEALAAVSDRAAGAIEARQEAPIPVRVDRELAGVIPEFLANRRQDVTSLRDALARGDFETIWRLGHHMRGSGAGYGFEAITQIGEGIEHTARARRPEEVRRWTEELAVYLERVQIVSE